MKTLVVSPGLTAMPDGPAMKPPPGTQSNLENPSNNNAAGYGLVIAASVICSSLVLIRLYTRAFVHKKIIPEDGIAVAALGLLGGFLYCTWMIIDRPGIFVHLWDIRLRDLSHVLYYLNAGTVLYGNIIMLLKIGILLEWARIFVPKGFRTRSPFWWTCHIVISVNVVFYVICTFVEIFGCTPRAKLWNPTLPGTCLDMSIINPVSAVINFLSDLFILCLPQKVIWGLNMGICRKLGMALLFAVGILACICAGFRIPSALNFARSDDILYAASNMAMWCISEMICGFLVFCLPSTAKLFANSRLICKLLAKFEAYSMATSKNFAPAFGHGSAPVRQRKYDTTPASLFLDSEENDIGGFSSASITSVVTVRSEIADSFRAGT